MDAPSRAIKAATALSSLRVHADVKLRMTPSSSCACARGASVVVAAATKVSKRILFNTMQIPVSSLHASGQPALPDLSPPRPAVLLPKNLHPREWHRAALQCVPGHPTSCLPAECLA